jgi:hypothetical protein
MYPIAVRDRFLINEPTLQGLNHMGRSGLGDAVSTTIDTLAQDAAAIIQASSDPNKPPVYGGVPIYPTAAQTGIGVGAALLLGLGVYVLVRALR